MKRSIFATGFNDAFTEASIQYATRHAGTLDGEELLSLLEQIQSVAMPDGNSAFAPHLLVQGPAQDHCLWVRGGKLYHTVGKSEGELGDAVTPEEVCERLDAERVAVPKRGVRARRPRSAKRTMAIVLLVVVASIAIQLVLIGTGYYSLEVPLVHTPITSSETLNTLRDKYTGVFWSDDESERIVLALNSDGQSWVYVASVWESVEDFSLLESVPYTFAYIEGRAAIVLDEHESVEISSDGPLLFDGDRLQRAPIRDSLTAALMIGGQK